MKRTSRYISIFSAGMALLTLALFAPQVYAMEELDKIDQAIIAKGHRWVASENHVAKLPPEIRKMRLGAIKPALTESELRETERAFASAALSVATLPPALDWRSYSGRSYVSPVKDQGNCGSCWAFAAAAALESATLIANGTNVIDLAEQILVSCSGAGSCSGGYIDQASNFLKTTGLPAESYAPYVARNASCPSAAQWQILVSRIDGWNWVSTTSTTVDALRNALNSFGPLVTTMDVYTDFYYYSGGVYKHSYGSYEGGHAVLLVGYDDASGYFIVKNSWGGGWGESGFFRIAYSELASVVNFGDYSIAYRTAQADLPPTGSLAINGGAAATNSGAVTLSLAADDTSGVSQMCISNTATCTAWTAFAAAKSWQLPSGNGTKTVYVWFKDLLGNANTSPYSDSIVLDATVPVNGSMTAVKGDGGITLAWTGFSDAASGIAGYKVVYATTGAPRNCASGTAVYNGSATSYQHTGLSGGTTYYYRVCGLDNAGNISTGITASLRYLPETVPPTGTIAINGGAAITNSRTVALSLAAEDTSGVSQMCISNTATCSAWTAFAAAKSWQLPSGNGTKTVYVWFKDLYGTANTSPYSASIVLDATAPVNGSMTAVKADGGITLAWTGFSDATSGIAGYKVVYATTGAPRNCASGTAVYNGSAASYQHAGLSAGTTYYYRVCGLDNAGNISTGVTASLRM